MQPTACIIDSQSTKTTAVGGFQVGYNAGKKIKGRKRHIVAKQDRDAAQNILLQTHKKHRSITVAFADGRLCRRIGRNNTTEVTLAFRNYPKNERPFCGLT
jgi:hypothetical protein